MLTTLGSVLPKGGSLPPDEWKRRHRALLGLLWLNALAFPLGGIIAGSYGAVHTLEHTVVLVVLATAANMKRFAPKLRSAFTSLGLLSAAALLVHLTGGLIEAHFYFFVLIIALTLYEDWLPFLLAVGYVVLHHGLVGSLAPESVYAHAAAVQHPWVWAGIHAFFVALAGAAGVVAWRLNEDIREKMKRAQRQLATLSETDSLTGLSNHRKALADLEALFEEPASENVVLLLDLDGFKSYNDTFGHPAGDALLARLGQRLQSAVSGRATAYRLGGDEFFVLGPGSAVERASLEAAAAAALTEQGQAFSVTATFGSVVIPAEAGSAFDAMRLADQQMYARKQSSRLSAMSQTKDVLLKVLSERHPELGDHLDQVRELVAPVAEALGMPEDEIATLCHAAELHDTGKVAIPDAILQKPGPLDDSEWEFVRRHTTIGQRIVAVAPALKGVGEMIRSSHERWDGAGYPDGIAGDEINMGSRIIAVCDAYDAMTTDRPYRRAVDPDEALAELRRCAGHQFDPNVVSAFESALAEPRRVAVLDSANGSRDADAVTAPPAQALRSAAAI